MSKFLIAVLSLAMFASPVCAQQQRLRGTVASFENNRLTVKPTSGGNAVVTVTPNTEIIFTQPISISEIKPGDFLGVTSEKNSDGALTAFEIRRFPKPVNPGHRPFLGRKDQTMTNATVSNKVQSANGQELTLTYEGGSQKITVAHNASISMLVPGQASQLVPDAPVNVTALTDPDGKLRATRIQVSAPKK